MRGKCTAVNLRHEAYDVYVGRPGHGEDGYFGNPFVIGQDGDRTEVIAKFKVWFERRLEQDPTYRARVLALTGKRLGCFCHPQTCHGDVIAAWVNKQQEAVMAGPLDSLTKVDSFMDDDIMRADPKALVPEQVAGMFVILKALGKVVEKRIQAVGNELRTRVPPGKTLETDLFKITHSVGQREPTLDLGKVLILVQQHDLPQDSVFIVPPVEDRKVDLVYLEAHVPKDELDACFVTSGQALTLYQTARGALKRRLADVIR